MRRVLSVAVLFVLFVGMFSVMSPVQAATTVVTVTSDGSGDPVNIRANPSMSADIITKVQPGTDLQPNSIDVITSADGWKWIPVALPDGRSGYIRQDLVSAPHTQSVAPAPSSNTYVTPTGSSSQAVGEWFLRHSSDVTVLGTDFKSIQTAANLESFPLMLSGCTSLSRHLSTIATIEPIPDPEIARHFSAAILHFYSFANQCIVAGTIENGYLLQAALPELNKGTAELDLVIAAMP